MKTVILHIGANKTGSSAIQEFLRLNADVLRQYGFLVAPADLTPRGEVTGQHVWLIEQLRGDPAVGRKRIRRRIDRLFSANGPASAIIISAENLALRSRDPVADQTEWDPNGAHLLFAGLAHDYDVRVVLYIRRQDELLVSSWQQWESKTRRDFWAWVTTAMGREGNWRSVLQAWEEIVPWENITVRIYERSRMPNGDVVTDFVSVLGLGDDFSALRQLEGRPNATFVDSVMDFAKGNPLIFRDRHDNDFYTAVERFSGGRYHRRTPVALSLTYPQRCAILENYRDSNAWVRDRYFPHQQGELFAPPECPKKAGPSREGEKWDLAASLIHKLADRLQLERQGLESEERPVGFPG